MSDGLIIPQWPVSKHVKAISTMRYFRDGESGIKQSFNLAAHADDGVSNVIANRRKLAQSIGLADQQFSWLSQVHGTEVVELNGNQHSAIEADAACTKHCNRVCVVMTADCLPVLIADETGTQVAAVHAGWRGLSNGVIENTVQHFETRAPLLAWLGPAIGPQHFEVGEDVYRAFVDQNANDTQAFVPASRPEHWYADIYQLARNRLCQSGVSKIFGGDFCTVRDSDQFFSYRRERGLTGRMASMIWIED